MLFPLIIFNVLDGRDWPVGIIADLVPNHQHVSAVIRFDLDIFKGHARVELTTKTPLALGDFGFLKNWKFRFNN